MLACICNYGEVTGRSITAHHLAQWQFPTNMPHAVLDKTKGHPMKMWHLLVNPKYKELWGNSDVLLKASPESEKVPTLLFSSNARTSQTNANVTYPRVCVNYCLEKEDPNRTQVTVGGNLLHYPGNSGTPTVNMITVKLHLNSIISTKNACDCTIDVKDFYLNTPMDQPEVMRIKLSNLTPNFVKFYNLTNLANNDGTIYVKIQKGMYQLPQGGILAQNLLKKQLNQHGYQQNKVTLGLWKHDWQPILFTLCVNNFGIKYLGWEHAKHLTKILNEHYQCSIDWDGKRYLGMNMDWDNNGHRVHVLMLDYVPKALAQLQHRAPNKPQHQLYPQVKLGEGAVCRRHGHINIAP